MVSRPSLNEREALSLLYDHVASDPGFGDIFRQYDGIDLNDPHWLRRAKEHLPADLHADLDVLEEYRINTGLSAIPRDRLYREALSASEFGRYCQQVYEKDHEKATELPLREARKIANVALKRVGQSDNLFSRGARQARDGFARWRFSERKWAASDNEKLRLLMQDYGPTFEQLLDFDQHVRLQAEILSVAKDDPLLHKHLLDLSYMEDMAQLPDMNSRGWVDQLVPGVEADGGSLQRLRQLYSRYTVAPIDSAPMDVCRGVVARAIAETSKLRGLCLSGGGAKGVAYGGLLQHMEQRGELAELEAVAGTSAGAITAMAVAVGYNSLEISDIVGKAPFALFFHEARHAMKMTAGSLQSLSDGKAFAGQVKQWCADKLRGGKNTFEKILQDEAMSKAGDPQGVLGFGPAFTFSRLLHPDVGATLYQGLFYARALTEALRDGLPEPKYGDFADQAADAARTLATCQELDREVPAELDIHPQDFGMTLRWLSEACPTDGAKAFTEAFDAHFERLKIDRESLFPDPEDAYGYVAGALLGKDIVKDVFFANLVENGLTKHDPDVLAMLNLDTVEKRRAITLNQLDDLAADLHRLDPEGKRPVKRLAIAVAEHHGMFEDKTESLHIPSHPGYDGDIPIAELARRSMNLSVFAPIVDEDGREFVDGGYVNNTPENLLRKMGIAPSEYRVCMLPSESMIAMAPDLENLKNGQPIDAMGMSKRLFGFLVGHGRRKNKDRGIDDLSDPGNHCPIVPGSLDTLTFGASRAEKEEAMIMGGIAAKRMESELYHCDYAFLVDKLVAMHNLIEEYSTKRATQYDRGQKKVIDMKDRVVANIQTELASRI